MPRVVIESPNLGALVEPNWAWSSGDVLQRFEKLTELSTAERKRLASEDEVSMVVGHLAEVAHLRVYPFRLKFHDGKLGSEVEIAGDDGEPVFVFRALTDMLQARVAKFPEDYRAKETQSWFEYWVEPQAQALNEGEWLVFFSPPDPDSNSENRYGFAYLYRKEDNEIDATSIRLDWVNNQYSRTDLGFFGPGIQSIEQILQILGGEAQNLAESYIDERNKYFEIEQVVKSGHGIQAYIEAISNGNHTLMEEYLTQERVRVLQQYQPHIWSQIAIDIATNGYSVINIGCGPMMFGGYRDGSNWAMVGIGDPENYIYFCHACGHPNPIDAAHGIFCETCEACGVAAEKCV